MQQPPNSTPTATGDEQQSMSLGLALLPIIVLVAALGFNVLAVYGDDALAGSSQMLSLIHI